MRLSFKWFERKKSASAFEIIEGVEPNISDSLLGKYSSYHVSESSGAVIEDTQGEIIQGEIGSLPDIDIVPKQLEKSVRKDSKEKEYIDF